MNFLILLVTYLYFFLQNCFAAEFFPNVHVFFVYPDPLVFYGDHEVYTAYKKILDGHQIKSSSVQNFSNFQDLDTSTINLITARRGGKPFDGEKALYSYLISQMNTAANLVNVDLYKRIFVVGKNCLVPDQSEYPTVYDFYFTVSKSDFCALNFESLFFCGGGWDNRYQKSLAVLDAKEFFHWYGPISLKNKKSYKGFCDSVVDRIKQHGVVLVLHSKNHIENAEPSLRIFEAAAASSLIISDRNPFVVNNFGDSVLYIDQNDSEEKIAQDIIDYYNWARTHTIEAQLMSQRSHKIFCDRFTLEDQVLRLIHIHQETLILDGEKPLPPRGPFLNIFLKPDLKKMNQITSVLMMNRFSIQNTKGSVESIKLLLEYTNLCQDGDVISPPLNGYFLIDGEKIQNFKIKSHLEKPTYLIDLLIEVELTIAGLSLEAITLPDGYYLKGIDDFSSDQCGLSWSEDQGFKIIL